MARVGEQRRGELEFGLGLRLRAAGIELRHRIVVRIEAVVADRLEMIEGGLARALGAPWAIHMRLEFARSDRTRRWRRGRPCATPCARTAWPVTISRMLLAMSASCWRRSGRRPRSPAPGNRAPAAAERTSRDSAVPPRRREQRSDSTARVAADVQDRIAIAAPVSNPGVIRSSGPVRRQACHVVERCATLAAENHRSPRTVELTINQRCPAHCAFSVNALRRVPRRVARSWLVRLPAQRSAKRRFSSLR